MSVEWRRTYGSSGIRALRAGAAFAAAVAVAAAAVLADDPSHDAFTYQGQLKHNGVPAVGPLNLRFRLFDAPFAGYQVGPELVADGFDSFDDAGLFTIDLAFGKDVFDGSALWLEIQVNAATLSPRQPLMPAPYAIRALTAGSVGSSALAGTYSNPLSLTNPANSFVGTFSGVGAGLTNLNASYISSGILGGSRLGGTYTNALSFTNVANVFAGDGFALTNLNAASITGVIPNAALSGTYTNALSFTNAANTFAGNGAGLTNLDAGNIGSGVLSELRLSSTLLGRLAERSTTAIPVAGASSGFGRCIALSGNHAHIAGFGFLRIVDITDPLSPVVVGNTAGHSEPRAIAVAGGFAYVVGADSLAVFDVSNPAAPATTTTIGTFGELRGISVASGHAYVVRANPDALLVFGLGNPASPSLVSTTELSNPFAIAVAANRAYVVGGGALRIMDVTNPGAPVLMGTVATAVSDIAVSGNYAYGVNLGPATLEVFDVSLPSAPALVGSVAMANAPHRLALSGSFVFVVHTQRLTTIDVANPTAPVVAHTIAEVGPEYTGIAQAGDFVYISAIGPPLLRVFRSESNYTFSGSVAAASGFSGSGAGLTNLNASNLASGTIGSGLLGGTYSNALTFSNAGNTFAGSGAGLTNLNASNIASGNLGAAVLPTGGNWSITSNLNLANSTFVVNPANKHVGIGVTDPQARLHIGGGISGAALIVPGLSVVDGNVIGGVGNEVTPGVTGAAIGGGGAGLFGPNSVTANFGTIGGGFTNTVSGQFASVPGGANNTAAGQFSLAAGRRAKANHNGVFVWADSTNADVASTGDNQFLIRAGGGVGIGTNAPNSRLHVDGGSEASLADGSGAIQTGPTDGRNMVFGNGRIYARNNGQLDQLLLRTSGLRVGIDTGSQAFGTLHVESTAGQVGFMVRFGTNTRLRVDDNGGTSIGANVAGPTNGLRIAGQSHLLGNVGIGTTNPLAELHVQGQLHLAGTASDITWPTNEVLQLGQWDGTTFTERMRITSAGNVGIGTSSPGSFLLAVNGSAAKPGGGSWSVFSDARLKRDIQPLAPGTLDQLLSITGYTFGYLDEAVENRLALPGRQIGLIAQEVAEVFPNWVDADDEGYLYITERGTTAILVEALRELRAEKDAQIEQQQATIDSLSAQLAELTALVHHLLAQQEQGVAR